MAAILVELFNWNVEFFIKKLHFVSLDGIFIEREIIPPEVIVIVQEQIWVQVQHYRCQCTRMLRLFVHELTCGVCIFPV